MKEKKEKIALLIVAAGESKRLGQPKQLVKKNGTTLLENTLIEAKKSTIKNVFLVLGANANLIMSKIQITDIQVFINKKWAKGIGESITFGIRKIIELGNYEGVLISVADQPFLSSSIFQEIEKVEKSVGIIIRSKYSIGNGPPVYFSKQYFEELTQLTGDEGAKSLIKKYKNQVVNIDFPKGNIDIDREEDLKYWE